MSQSFRTHFIRFDPEENHEDSSYFLAPLLAAIVAISPSAWAQASENTQATIQQLDSSDFEFTNAPNEADLAKYLDEMSQAKTETDAQAALNSLLGPNAAKRTIQENSASADSIVPYGAGTFLTCIRGKASEDIKSVFDVNVVAAAIGQKDYVKAAHEAVKFLAKQGVKRNAAALVAMFAYWGFQCRGSW